METLDLTLAPPRSPREKLAGLDLFMAARTVDKLRASLPGGNLGAYKIAGFSARLLDALNIAEGTFRDVVARAGSDAEIAAWIRENTDEAVYPEFNAAMVTRRIVDYAEDQGFFERYPVARELSPETPIIDVLAADDRALFGLDTAPDAPRV